MSAALIGERRKTHGDFADTARIARRLKAVIDDELARRAGRGQAALSDEQREALDQDQTKTARIIAGDPGHADHWRDKAGYALLGIPFDGDADARDCYEVAIGAIGAGVKAGAPVPTTGYFGSGAVARRTLEPAFPRPELLALVEEAVAAFNAMGPAEQQAHLERQRESWVRGETGIGLDREEAAERARLRGGKEGA